MAGLNARFGDLFVGVCACHPPSPPISMGGTIIGGLSSIQVESSSQARTGDIGIGYCGHPTIIVGGSSTSQGGGAGKARTGDVVAGCISGIIITGAGTAQTGG